MGAAAASAGSGLRLVMRTTVGSSVAVTCSSLAAAARAPQQARAAGLPRSLADSTLSQYTGSRSESSAAWRSASLAAEASRARARAPEAADREAGMSGQGMERRQ